MAKKNTLETLAPEIQVRILLNVHTPKELHALVQASPRLYQVFLLNKSTILPAVARRQFHPAVVPDVLFFAEITKLEHPLLRRTVLDLCKNYPSDPPKGLVISIPMSVTLCKLARNIKFFIEDYSRNTLPLMEEVGRSLEVNVLSEYFPDIPVSYSKLSGSEIGRLQRAFCRFETYRYLFTRCSPEFDHNLRICAQMPALSPAEQASLFLQKFPDFQITEINCIRDYFYRRLIGICRQLEDGAVENLPPETVRYDPVHSVEDGEWISRAWPFTYGGKPYLDIHLEHVMSQGLAYIRRIFESIGSEQETLFLRHINRALGSHEEREFMTTAFDCLGRNPAGRDIPLLAKTDPPFVYKVNPDVDLDIPDAWQWAHPRAPPLHLFDSGMKGLRDWGFVFWDMDRLRKSGILERSSEDIRLIEFDEYEAIHGPSVQERIIGPPDELADSDDEEYSELEDLVGLPDELSGSDDEEYSEWED